MSWRYLGKGEYSRKPDKTPFTGTDLKEILDDAKDQGLLSVKIRIGSGSTTIYGILDRSIKMFEKEGIKVNIV